MEIHEVEKLAKNLYSQLHRTNSIKKRGIIISDIIDLERLLYVRDGLIFDAIDKDDLYFKQYYEVIQKEKKKKLDQAIFCYDMNLYLTKEIIETSILAEYKPKFYIMKGYVNNELLVEQRLAFINSLGEKFKNKYYHMMQNNAISIIEPTFLSGICFNFSSVNLQEIVISDYKDNLLTNYILVHELGHAVHMDILNSISSNIDSNIFNETLAVLIEWQFLMFLESKGINTLDFQKIFLVNFLAETILLYEYSSAINVNEALICDYDIVTTSDILRSKDYIEKLGLNNNYGLIFGDPSYIEASKKFYARLIAFALIDKYSEDAVFAGLDFLIRSLNMTQEEAIKYLNISGVPDELRRQLKK